MKQVNRIQLLQQLGVEICLFQVLITQHLNDLKFKHVLELFNHILLRGGLLISWLLILMIVFFGITIVVLNDFLLFLNFLHELIVFIL